jgi:hypothetical protein
MTAEQHRGEGELERADRNWTELLGELRVTQTGVAILFSLPTAGLPWFLPALLRRRQA